MINTVETVNCITTRTFRGVGAKAPLRKRDDGKPIPLSTFIG